MPKHKYRKLVCIMAVIFAVMLAIVIIYFQVSHSTQHGKAMQYETRLFNTEVVHTINIIIDQSDWNKIQENAAAKEYQKCDVVIDGETFQNAAIRAKGNSSLASVTQQDSPRYSFKIEFDHYNTGNTCWGLDKLSLNNLIQDSTYLKDFLSYTLMREMGAYAPLCSYIQVQVNGEDFGLYLAVEGVEEAFAERNFGTVAGNLYKPETADGFGNVAGVNLDNQGNGQNLIQGQDNKNIGNGNLQQSNKNAADQVPGLAQANENTQNVMPDIYQQFRNEQDIGNFAGMSSQASDVALKYIDDEISSYSNIFDNAIFDATDQDKKRLISSIKQLNSGENLDKALNINEILRYFVVHNFVDNYDSYTGSKLHNYYLYEKNGKMSMIAWDYNLAFGRFGMGLGESISPTFSVDQATTYVNFPIDTPVSGTTMEERPLLNNLLSQEEYLKQYHEYFSEFLTNYFENGYCDKLIDSVSTLIAPYMKKDKTAFCTYDQFEKAVETLKTFCNLRAESIRGQLEGTIPSTADGQKNSDKLIDASSISISDMGSK